MVLRFLGESVTDSNGNAVLSGGYTGTGAGEVDIIAKTVIDDRIIQSETYAITDCIFYDDGVSGTNTKWDCLFVTKSSESNGTKFLCNSTNASARASMNPLDNASVFDFDAQPMGFECYLADLYIPSNAIGMQFLQTGSNPNKQMNFSTQDIGHTIKVVYDGISLIKYRDDVEVSRTSVTYTDKIRVGFTFYTVDGYIVVRDVKAYPI